MWLKLILAIIVAVLILLWKIRAKKIPGIPIVQDIPFFGSLLLLHQQRDRAFDFLAEKINEYKGKVWQFSLPTRPPNICLPGNEKMVKHILKDKFDSYIIPRQRFEWLGELFGGGIFGSNGDSWVHQRKAASLVFTPRLMKEYMTNVFVQHGETVLKRIGHAAATKQPIDLHDMFFRFTMDSFCEIAFGEKLGNLESDGQHPFSRAFDICQQNMFLRFFDVTWKLKRILSLGAEKTIKEQMSILNHHAGIFVQNRRNDIANKRVRDDLITNFINFAAKEQRELSDTELRDIIVNFIVAGRDTTACALSWFFYEVLQHPEVEAKVLEECQQLLRDGELPSFETAKNMSYTEAVLLETLRLHPSVPGETKECVKEDILPDGTKIPLGALVYYNPYAMGRSTDLWGADALEFKPQRWFSASGTEEELKEEASTTTNAGIHTKNHSVYKYVTFNAGPRLCLGRGLAILEAKLLIAMIMNSFKLSLAPNQKIEYLISVTLIMKNGMKVLAQPRN